MESEGKLPAVKIVASGSGEEEEEDLVLNDVIPWDTR